MKEFEIWSEGFRATGESGKAHLHCKIKAKSFEEAILRYAIENKDFYKNLSVGRNRDPEKDGKYFTYWGCKLFDNEHEARQSFG